MILKVFSNLKDSVSCDILSEKRTEVKNYFIDWAVSFKYNRHVVFYVLNRQRKARIPCDSASRFCIPFSVKTLSISLDGILKYVMALVFYSFNNLFLFLTTCLLKWNNYFSVENFYQCKNKLSICVLTIKTFCESGLYLSTYSSVPSRDLLRCWWLSWWGGDQETWRCDAEGHVCGHGVDGLMIGLDDLSDLFQP